MLSRNDVKDIYPLTPFQEGVLYHDQIDQEAARESQRAYFQQLVFRIRGKLDLRALEGAWQGLVDRHDILRTLFRTAAGAERPLQIVLKQRSFKLDVRDLSDLDGPERDRAVNAYVEEQRATPFDLARDQLMRVGALRLGSGEYVLVWSFHHILMDGWCIGLLQDELSASYTALAAGLLPALPEPPQFGAFVKWQQARRGADDLDFWARYLSGYDAPLPLPGQRATPLSGPRTLRSEILDLDPTLTARLRCLAGERRVTMNMLVQALWGLLQARLNDATDLVFGAVASIRPPELAQSERILGPCITTLPLRIRFDRGERVTDLLERVRVQGMEWLARTHCSPAEIQSRAGVKEGLYNHYIDYTNYPLDARHSGEHQQLADGVVISDIEAFITNNYDFYVLAVPGERLRLELCYNDRVVDGDAVAAMGRRLIRIAEQVAESPERPIQGISLLSPEERERILTDWCRGAAPAPLSSTLSELLDQVLAHSAASPALRDGSRTFSHEQLQARSRALALRLHRERGIGTGAAVAIAAPTGEPLVRAMLACLMLGAAFVPLDTKAPLSRNRHIIGDCGADLLLAQDMDVWRGVAGQMALLPLGPDEDGPGTAAVGDLPPVPGNATAYIIYTSGTTGVPKGVRVGQGSLLNYLGWMSRDLDIGAEPRSALVTSHAFDLGYSALFGTLVLGGCLTLLDEDARRDPERVMALLVEHRLTFLKLTPSYLSTLLEAPSADRFSEASDLRLLILGGEPQNFTDLQRLKAIRPDLALYNHYGPTEATIGCVAGPLDDLIGGERPPQRIGRPIAGARVLLCDSALQPVPPGVPGELLLGGAVTAQGYVGADAQDAQHFLESSALGGRVYRSGDYGYWQEDGNIVFLGRRDDQVKVRGHRISLNGVETALRESTGIADAAVLVDRSKVPAGELSAFLIPEPDATPDLASLRAELAERVPEPMIPSHFVLVTRFPVTANGKLDRATLAQQLSAVPDVHPDARRGNATEEALRAMWRDILFLDEVGLDDDFFALGGHSIKAILLVSRVRSALQRDMGIRDLFDHPTVRALGRFLDHGGPGGDLINLRGATPGGPTALFFPPILGTSTVYKELVSALGRDLDCRGFQHPGFDRDEPFTTDIPALAELYCRRIDELAIAGPLTLAGWSMGAHVAMEVAKRLEADDRSVRLVLLDAAPRAGSAVAPGLTLEPRFSGFAELRRMPYWGGVLKIIVEQLSAEEVARIERLALHNQDILAGYRFQGRIAADITCIEARNNPTAAGMQGFSALTQGQVRVHRVEGDHYSMFHPPHVHQVQQFLENALALD